MDHLEMVEKLREKANVSYEEASAALEKCNWDLLDALLLLEGEGRLNNDSQQTHKKEEYTTRPQPKANKKESHGAFAMLMHGFSQVVKRMNSVSLIIKKNNEERLSLSLTVVVLLLIFTFWFALIAAVIGMVFGYRYSIKGLSFDEPINDAMNKAGNFVDDIAKAGPTVVVVDHQKKDAQNTEGTVE